LEYEVKFDGYRALAIKSGGRVRLLSRNENDLADRFPILVQALAELPDETSIDGELVALDEKGRPSFNLLQNYRRAGTPLQFYAFDVLTLAGRSLQDRPLEERRKVLRTKVLPRMPDSVLFSETLEASASEIREPVKVQGLEGVIAKRRDSLYESGRRSGAWVKMRVNKSRELVVGGYVANGKNFDSIVVGTARAGAYFDHLGRIVNGERFVGGGEWIRNVGSADLARKWSSFLCFPFSARNRHRLSSSSAAASRQIGRSRRTFLRTEAGDLQTGNTVEFGARQGFAEKALNAQGLISATA
jgi:hypothetical protein